MAVESLLQQDGVEAMAARVMALGPENQPQWGKMTCAQMLAHCQKPYQVAFGELELKRGWIGRLFGGMAKKKFVHTDAPFNRNSPTDPRFLQSGAADVAQEQEALVKLVRRFGAGETVITMHPFFGELSHHEWDRLMWKHLDHHLRQFGV